MKPRRKPAQTRKPDWFPDENVVMGWTPAQLAAHSEYEQFHFVGCDFGEASLANIRFTDCLFERCNLSAATVANAALQNVAFAECKLLGVQFTACRDMLFAVHFDHCQLRYASFAGKKMPATRFAHCALDEADFTNADLTAGVFDECVLTRTVFHDTVLLEADFRTASGFVIDPEANRLRGAKFALAGLPGLLEKYEVVVS